MVGLILDRLGNMGKGAWRVSDVDSQESRTGTEAMGLDGVLVLHLADLGIKLEEV